MFGTDANRPFSTALHLHSHFSLLRGTDSPADLLAQAASAGYSAVALTDVNGLYGAVPFYQAARAMGVKPIVGVELLMEEISDFGFRISDLKDEHAESIQNPKSKIQNRTGRLVLLARNGEGYRNLCRLTSKRQLTPEDFDLLQDVPDHRAGLFVLCDRAEWLKPLAVRLERGQLFAEITPVADADPEARLSRRRLYAAAVEAGVPAVAAIDSYFANSEFGMRNAEWELKNRREDAKTPGRRDTDISSRRGVVASSRPSHKSEIRNPKSEMAYRLHRVVTDIRLGTAGRPPCEQDYQPPDRFLWPADAMRRFFSRCPEALANAERIAAACGDEVLELGKFHFPISRTPPGQTGFSHLHRLCQAGLRRRYRPVTPEAVSRLAYELSVINKLHFADYFLFVNEIVSFARRRGIPLDVRGSAAGSLVAYVLGFTQVCPLAHELYFERFLHEGRTDCPDIDIDLCWRRRDEVIDFCYRRWGRRHVAMISTHQTFRARGAFGEVGKTLGLTPGRIHALSRHIPEGIAAYLRRDWRELAEARRNLPLDDPHFRRVLDLAGRLEGAPRHLSIHCGGLVISPGSLTDYLPLERASKGIVVTQYEMNAVEAVGLVKMDLLGNRALSEIAEAGREISDFGLRIADLKERRAASIQNPKSKIQNPLEAIDPADPATAALVSSGDTLGVFQAESPGMRNLCRQLRVSSREELTVALSVIRPGPAAVGMKAAYVMRHLGLAPAEYLHPKLAGLLGRTHGVMLYQEDTMRVAVGIAGFTPAEADMLRKAVSKKRSGERMAVLRARFIERAARHTPDLPPQAAEKLWEQIAHFAGYSFCRAHACVYGRIAWQTAWLKAHHPAAFYVAVFNNHLGMYPLRVHVSDALRHGLTVLPPHVNCSQAEAALCDRLKGEEEKFPGLAQDLSFLPSLPGRGQGEGQTVATPGPLVLAATAIPSPGRLRRPPSLCQGEGEKAIRLGLNFVRGLSRGAIQRIITARPFRRLADLRRPALGLTEPELVNLVRCGACDGLGEHRPAMLAELTLEAPPGALAADFGFPILDFGFKVNRDATACVVQSKIQNPKSEMEERSPPSFRPADERRGVSPFPWTRPFTPVQTAQAEIDVLGLFLSCHPMDLVRGDWTPTDRLADRVGRRLAVAGILDATRTTQTRDGKLMRFITLEDRAGLVECTFFPEAYERFGHLFYHLGPFRVEGVVENDRGAITLTAERAESLVDEYPLTLAAELYPPSQIV